MMIVPRAVRAGACPGAHCPSGGCTTCTTATVMALEDSGSRMSRLGSAELGIGEFVDLEETMNRVRSVTSPGPSAASSWSWACISSSTSSVRAGAQPAYIPKYPASE
jgi:hypothetical protein